MYKWLVKKLFPHIMESCIACLDDDKRYMLFLPTDVDHDRLRESTEHWRGKVDLVIILTDQFNLIEF